MYSGTLQGEVREGESSTFTDEYFLPGMISSNTGLPRRRPRFFQAFPWLAYRKHGRRVTTAPIPAEWRLRGGIDKDVLIAVDRRYTL